MDGTALYQGVAAVFLAQVFGIEFTIGTLLLVIVTAVGASIGTPATPGVGIIILATVLQSAGIPTDGIALIIGVDRILDMCRTAINVTGDMTACTVYFLSVIPCLVGIERYAECGGEHGRREILRVVPRDLGFLPV